MESRQMRHFDEHISRVNDKLQLLVKQFQVIAKRK